VNNPKFVLHALSILMDSQEGVAFVQCFQQFYDGIKDDPFGNQWVVAFQVLFSFKWTSKFTLHLWNLWTKELCNLTFFCFCLTPYMIRGMTGLQGLSMKELIRGITGLQGLSMEEQTVHLEETLFTVFILLKSKLG